MILDINTAAAYRFSNTLKELHRSALPSAVRDALSMAAKDVKTRTMPETSAEFVNRSPNFFKANSKFIPAKGFDINTMRSEVGFFDNNLRNKATNFAIKDLEEQEEGGVIEGRSYKPTIFARFGTSKSGLVRPNARLSRIKNIVNANKVAATNKKGKFFVAAKKAGRGGHVLWGNVLWRIDSDPNVHFTAKANLHGKQRFRGSIKRTPLYGYKPRGTAKVRKTSFMHDASFESLKRMDDFYIAQAKRQINKFMK